MKKITIAIDGYSSCGKSTMAKDLAREIGYVYVDSGAMYRTVTLYALEKGIIKDGNIDEERLRQEMKDIEISFQFNPERGRPDTYLNGTRVEDRIRTLEVSNHVSPIAALGFVREEMVRQQQRMGQKGGIIMDGRDIGTTVFPNAELKIFMQADDLVRAMRRYKETTDPGATFIDVLNNLRDRDKRDSTREVSPLRKADDAIVLDNTCMTMEQELEWLVNLLNEKYGFDL